jgi:hypothetical protein
MGRTNRFFPTLRSLRRTIFARQAAHLWRLKGLVWQAVVDQLPPDPTFAITDSFSLPACQCARAYNCRRIRGEAAIGKDTLVRQIFYDSRVHVRLEWPGIVTCFCLAPANIHELAVVPALAERLRVRWLATATTGRRYYRRVEGAGRRGVHALRSAKRDPHLRWRARLSRMRYRIATVLGQLVDRCAVKPF